MSAAHVDQVWLLVEAVVHDGRTPRAKVAALRRVGRAFAGVQCLGSMQQALDIIKGLCGIKSQGWYTGRDSPNTRRLVVEQESLIYDSDYYGDDLPLWMRVNRPDGGSKMHLVVPYTLDTNDMRFATAQGFNSGEQFYQYLRDSFDVLYAEGEDAPKMMSVGLHCRLVGRPGRFRALQRFLDYAQSKERVWICRRVDIARHWIDRHPPITA